MSETRKIDVIIPTYHPDEKLEKCLRMLKRQTVQPQRILLINTEEEFFHSKVFSTLKQGEIIHITKPEFDHGGTRNQAAAMCDGEIMILLTQDAIPADEHLIENLIKPFEDEEVCAAYGRQMADKKDNPVEAYTRIFNYPKAGLRVKKICRSLELRHFSVLMSVRHTASQNIMRLEDSLCIRYLIRI